MPIPIVLAATLSLAMPSTSLPHERYPISHALHPDDVRQENSHNVIPIWCSSSSPKPAPGTSANKPNKITAARLNSWAKAVGVICLGTESTPGTPDHNLVISQQFLPVDSVTPKPPTYTISRVELDYLNAIKYTSHTSDDRAEIISSEATPSTGSEPPRGKDFTFPNNIYDNYGKYREIPNPLIAITVKMESKYNQQLTVRIPLQDSGVTTNIGAGGDFALAQPVDRRISSEYCRILVSLERGRISISGRFFPKGQRGWANAASKIVGINLLAWMATNINGDNGGLTKRDYSPLCSTR